MDFDKKAAWHFICQQGLALTTKSGTNHLKSVPPFIFRIFIFLSLRQIPLQLCNPLLKAFRLTLHLLFCGFKLYIFLL